MSGTFWALALLCASGRPPPSRTATIDTAAAQMMRRFIYPPEPARVGLRPAPAFARTRGGTPQPPIFSGLTRGAAPRPENLYRIQAQVDCCLAMNLQREPAFTGGAPMELRGRYK